MKLDVSKIDGFDTMSDADKLKALLDLDVDDHASELAKLKDEMSKRNSEVANLKKTIAEKDEQIKAGLSAEEKAKLEGEEAIKKMNEELAALKKDKVESEYKANLIGLGYSEELAGETAKAYVDGDSAKVLENQKKFVEEHDKQVKAELMKGTPTPPAGAGSGTMTKENFMKMSREERFKFAEEHPQEYSQLYGKDYNDIK